MSLSNLGAELARAIETEPDNVVNAINETQAAINDGSFDARTDQAAEALINEALAGGGARGPSGPE